MSINKRVLMICLAFCVFSLSIIGTSIYAYPEDARAYATTQYNYLYNSIDYTGNNYRVGTIGIGVRQMGVLYMLIGGNVAVQVSSSGKSNSKLKSIRIIQTGKGYGLAAINSIVPVGVKTIENTTQCNVEALPATCTLHANKTINGIIFMGDLSIRVELIFDNGTYIVYPRQQETRQAT